MKEINELKREGLSIRAISRLTGYDRKTITAGSGLGPPYVARAKALSVGLSNAYFESLGLPSFVDKERYQLSNRRLRTRTHTGWQVGG